MDEKILKKFYFENNVFSFLLVCVALTTVSAIWQYNTIASLLIAINFIITTILTFSVLLKNMDKYLVLLWFGIAVVSFLAVFVSGEKITFEYLKLWIMFMSTINLFYWVASIKVTKIMVNNLFLCATAVAFMFVVAFYYGLGYGNSKLPDYLTFGMSNPNITAIYLLNVFLCLVVSLDFTGKKRVKLIRIILGCFMVYFILKTEARACMLGVVACLFLKVFGIKKYNKKFNFFMIILPLVFAIIYMEIIDMSIMELFEFAESKGKGLDSRVPIWQKVFKTIKENPFLGNYKTGGNLHNMHLAIMSTYGSFVAVGVIVFLNYIINDIGVKMEEKYQYMGLFAFYAVIVSGCFEATLFTGSQGMYVLSTGLLMVSKYTLEEEKRT